MTNPVWTTLEKNQLNDLYNFFTPEGRWALIAEDLPWRTSEACKTQWEALLSNKYSDSSLINYLLNYECLKTSDGTLSWTHEENRLLARAVRDFEYDLKLRKWEWISQYLPGRTPLACRLRYHSQSTQPYVNPWTPQKIQLLHRLAQEQLKTRAFILWKPIGEALETTPIACRSRYKRDITLSAKLKI